MKTPTRLTVGTMNFGQRTPPKEAEAIVSRALERGMGFFDTANVYGDGESERILGAALKGRREQAGIATKVGIFKNEGLSAARVKGAIDESLKRLGTDRVELYYLHKPDPATPLTETVDAIAEVVKSGRALSWGVSNFASWQILELNRMSDERGIARPAVSQVLYNLLVRQLDVEYFAFTRAHPIHTTVYNPLAGGLLARGTTRLSTSKIYARRYGSEALAQLRDRFEALAKDAGMDLVTLSYAWLTGTPGVDSILAGPGSLPHLDAAIDAISVPVSKELRGKIDELHRDFLGTDARYMR